MVLVHPQRAQYESALSLTDLDALYGSLLEDHFDFLSATQYCPVLAEIRELVGEAEARSNGSAYGFAQAAAR